MKIKVYIHAEYQEWEKKYHFKPWCFDMSNTPHCGPLVGVHEFDFDAPPHESLVAGTVAQYREMQKEVMAEAEVKRLHLEQKINELLCIEYKPGNEVATGTTE